MHSPSLRAVLFTAVALFCGLLSDSASAKILFIDVQGTVSINGEPVSGVAVEAWGAKNVTLADGGVFATTHSSESGNYHLAYEIELGPSGEPLSINANLAFSYGDLAPVVIDWQALPDLNSNGTVVLDIIIRDRDGIYTPPIGCSSYPSTCPSGMYCVDSFCEPDSSLCTDTDRGIDFYTSGALQNHFLFWDYDTLSDLEDYCIPDSPYIFERFCASNPHNFSMIAFCPNGCSDGACLPDPFDLPLADAGVDQAIYAWIDGYAEVTLDGLGSYDPDTWLDGLDPYFIDGDGLAYEWDLDLSLDSDMDGNPSNDVNETGAVVDCIFPVGQTEIALVVRESGVHLSLGDRLPFWGPRSDPDITIVTVVEALETTAKLIPRTLNRRRREPYVVGWLEMTGVNAEDINPKESLLLLPGDIEAQHLRSMPIKSSSKSLMRMGRFDAAALLEAIKEDGDAEVTLMTKLASGQWVYGTDTISIKSTSPRN